MTRRVAAKLANHGHDTRAIQQYLGHKNIQDTVRYTEGLGDIGKPQMALHCGFASSGPICCF